MGKRRAAMGCYSAVLHFRWPCRWLYGNSGSLLSPFAADIAAVFVIVGLGYAAMLQEPFRPKSAAFTRPDGL